MEKKNPMLAGLFNMLVPGSGLLVRGQGSRSFHQDLYHCHRGDCCIRRGVNDFPEYNRLSTAAGRVHRHPFADRACAIVPETVRKPPFIIILCWTAPACTQHGSMATSEPNWQKIKTCATRVIFLSRNTTVARTASVGRKEMNGRLSNLKGCSGFLYKELYSVPATDFVHGPALLSADRGSHARIYESTSVISRLTTGFFPGIGDHGIARKHEGTRQLINLFSSRLIERPIKQVFDFISTPENDAQWQYGTLATARLPKASGSLQTFFRSIGHLMGRRNLGTFEVTEYEPNKNYGFKSLTGPVHSKTSYSLESMNDWTQIHISILVSVPNFFQITEEAAGTNAGKTARGGCFQAQGDSRAESSRLPAATECRPTRKRT